MLQIDSFPLFFSLLPLATYLLLLGAMRLSRRPLVTTQSRDGAALAIALVGLVMIGPVHLFFPSAAAAELGWIVWVVLGVFYTLCVSLILMSLKPKIVLYGISPLDALVELHKAAITIDSSAIIDQDRMQVDLPSRGVHLRIEHHGLHDVVQIEAFERNLHPHFWRHLLLQLRQQTHSKTSPFSIGGLVMLVAGLFLMSICVRQIYAHPTEILAGFRQWMRV